MADELETQGDPALVTVPPVSQEDDPIKLKQTIAGYQGRNTQLDREKKAAEGQRDALKSQLDVSATQLADLTNQLDSLRPVAAELPNLQKQLKDSEARLQKQSALMKFPVLLREDVRALVESSTLEGDALEGYLQSLASAFTIGTKPVTGGATPPPPKGEDGPPERKAEDVRNEALDARARNDMAAYERLISESYALRDKEKGRFLPPDAKDANPGLQ